MISPWENNVHLTSPDGKSWATMAAADEVGMGAPTAGELVLSNGMKLSGCNPSLVWSDDAAYLAVPQWTRQRQQRLMVISLAERQLGYAPSTYRVLQLESFVGGLIGGIDSPVYQPRQLTVSLDEIEWELFSAFQTL